MARPEKRKGIKGAWSATVICFLVAAIVIIIGYTILSIFRDYKILDFIDSVVGNLSSLKKNRQGKPHSKLPER